MLCFPNCKINLGLYVTSKREDGYHDIETIFYPLPLYDILEIIPAAETRLHITGLAVAGNEQDNLVWKAYKLLQDKMPGKIPSLDIYLHKIIPMGAGLGGGSADGAFTLRLINDHFQLGLPDNILAEYALQLGSDCPFFIYNAPHFATGRGERMETTDIDLSAYSIQLICPKVHVSTAAAFRLITPAAALFDLRELNTIPVEHWRNNIRNDFEAPVFKEHPVLADIKRQLYEKGALYAAMSGSGSAIFGIFPKGKSADIQIGIEYEEFYVESPNMKH
jgi:4-diphosphocytidyl-2-C-methyl-D-erythritol kinase